MRQENEWKEIGKYDIISLIHMQSHVVSGYKEFVDLYRKNKWRYTSRNIYTIHISIQRKHL